MILYTGWELLFFFTFIEASGPFEDKSFTFVERDYLVEYWSQHALPAEDMFTFFRALFWDRKNEKPFLEMSEKSISKLLDGMKRALPVIFADLERGKREAVSQKDNTNN